MKNVKVYTNVQEAITNAVQRTLGGGNEPSH